MALRPRAPTTNWGRAFESAFEAGLALAVGAVVGIYLDRRFETMPLFLFVFMVLGFVTAMRRLLSIRLPGGPGEKEGPGSGKRGGDA